MIPVMIDTDPGIDDAIALLLALASPELDVVAATAVTGNLTADRTSHNLLQVLDLAGRPDIPVAQGQLTPLVRPYPRDPFSHGDNGLAEIKLPPPSRVAEDISAQELIVRMGNEHAGELTLICLGPMTNLALALQLDPKLPSKIRRVVAIAGAYGFTRYAVTQATGDNPVSEWNVYVDPEAAQQVFAANFNLTAVGLDVSTQPEMNLTNAELASLAASKSFSARFLAAVVDFVQRRGYQPYCGLIDSLAVAAVLRPDLFTVQTTPCAVETSGTLTLGMTVVDARNHHRRTDLPAIDVVSDVDFTAFRQLLLSRLT